MVTQECLIEVKEENIHLGNMKMGIRTGKDAGKSNQYDGLG
jgi:hypothetical protein